MINRKIPFTASIALISLASLLLIVIVLSEANLSSLNGQSVVSMYPLPPKSIIIISPLTGGIVSSPINITGYVNDREWAAFEGQVGSVVLIDNEGKTIGEAVLTATTDWMRFPVYFETEIKYNIPVGKDGFLIFRNENPSGIETKNHSIKVPIVFKTYLSQTVDVLVYFSNSQLDPDINCEKVFPVTRQIERTEGLAKAALMELLSGPQKEETKAGYNTNINIGAKLNSITIDKGVAKVDFDTAIEKGVSGSCRVTAITSQITETLKQFTTITRVVISINGKTKGILQP
ncbi:MAG: GerMN domain-containing protein [bacterium]